MYYIFYIIPNKFFCFADKQCFAHLLGAAGRQRNFVELVDCLIGKEGDAITGWESFLGENRLEMRLCQSHYPLVN
jgi:hypothetical protein